MYSPTQPTMPQKSFVTPTRLMTGKDLPSGLRLNTLAGWNQTAADWRGFLENSPAGCFVAELDGQIVGTAATIIYENRFAWIGMVLVDPEFRNRGIGTQLLHKAIEHLDHLGIATMKLDATPLGKPIYLKLGFVPEYEIERWTLKRPAPVEPAQPVWCPNLEHAQIARICEFDRELFGADRSYLLQSLDRRAPELTNIAWKDDRPHAYSFGRKGLFADHLGPCAAMDPKIAEQLLRSFLERSARETLIVDCLLSHSAFLDSLRAAGFVSSRPLTRMFRGPNSHPGRPESICTILGPEFG